MTDDNRRNKHIWSTYALLIIAVIAAIIAIVDAADENQPFISAADHTEAYYLEVNGTLILQPDGTQTCNATTTGALYWDGSDHYACDGSAWTNITAGGVNDYVDTLTVTNDTTTHTLTLGRTGALPDLVTTFGDTDTQLTDADILGLGYNHTSDLDNRYSTGDHTNLTAADVAGYVQNDTILRNNTDAIFTNLNVTGLFTPTVLKATTLNYTWHDDGNSLTLNMTSVTDEFIIETDNTKFKLFNEPSAGNDYTAFEFFSGTAGVSTDFVIYEAGAERSGWYARSFRVGGPTGSSCTNLDSNILDYIDCNTSVTGADLAIEDDLWLGGSVWGNGTYNISVDGTAFFPSLLAGSTNLTTTQVAEGTNLYYTDGRAALAVQNTSIARVGDVVNVTSTFGGDVSGTYDAIEVGDNTHTHALANITATGNLDTDSTDDIVDDAPSQTITGNLVINGNFTIIGATFEANVTQQRLNGSFLPALDTTFDIGSPSLLWSTIYASTLDGALGWANLTSYPSACAAGEYVYQLGDTLLCSTPLDTQENYQWRLDSDDDSPTTITNNTLVQFLGAGTVTTSHSGSDVTITGSAHLTLGEVASNVGNWSADQSSYTLLTNTESRGNWTLDKPLYTLLTYTDSLGNWSADQSSYTPLSYTDSLGNWSADQSSYTLLTNTESRGNWSADKSSYTLLTNTESRGNWSADKSLYTLLTYSQSLGNWSADQSSYTPLTYTDSLGNWTQDQSSYTLLTNTESRGNWSADKSLYTLLTYTQSLGNWSNDQSSYTLLTNTESRGNWTLDKPNYALGDHTNLTDSDIAAFGYLKDIASNTTDDLDEGSTNLYYTDARAALAVQNTSLARTGTCAAGTVVQNLTLDGPECVTDATGGAGAVNGTAINIIDLNITQEGNITFTDTCNRIEQNATCIIIYGCGGSRLEVC